VPTVLRSGPYRFFFYAGEDRSEPPHVHVERDNLKAKFWLDPLRPAAEGSFSAVELRRIERIAREHRDEMLEQWYDNVAE
jgi:hypothetical protein